jgi:RimJ/RimL family protein N-acetyltransferase
MQGAYGLSVLCLLRDQVMIAEAEHRGKGYAREAVAMLMRYGVEFLGVTRYFCKVTQDCPVSYH